MLRYQTLQRRPSLAVCILAFLACIAPNASATIVRFDTSLGNIDVRLFGNATPLSVANFLNYVTDGDYDESIIHRAPPGFVIQGGGFAFPPVGGISSIPTDPPVLNEPGLNNLRGTLAYAKVGAQFDPITGELIPGTGPDSATSGWFFSVGDNSNNLNFQNGGFTVFGRVIGNGLQIIDEIASQPLVNAGGVLSELPVLDSFLDNPVNEQGLIDLLREDFIFVNTISILNFAGGDYDFDGDVDQNDLGVFRSQFGNSLRIVDHIGASPGIDVEADGNGDAVINGADYVAFRDSLTPSASLPAVSTVLTVPEPATAGGLAAMMLLAATRRRR